MLLCVYLSDLLLFVSMCWAVNLALAAYHGIHQGNGSTMYHLRRLTSALVCSPQQCSFSHDSSGHRWPIHISIYSAAHLWLYRGNKARVWYTCARPWMCIVGSVCRKWQKIHSIVGIVYDPVHDVAFAPNLGRYIDYQCNPDLHFIELLHHRSYHVLAVASKDVDIIHLVPSG